MAEVAQLERELIEYTEQVWLETLAICFLFKRSLYKSVCLTFMHGINV